MNVLNQNIGAGWALYNGDSCEVLKGIPENSIHYSITSIPFASLYTFSNSDRDLGNSKTYDEFAEHYRFLCDEWYRIMMPGRLVSIHCMNLPAMKERDGFIGIKDFRGDVIRWMQNSGFIFHSEVCIWKNPVVEMQRTKALGLLHKQIKKNSCMSRMEVFYPFFAHFGTLLSHGTNRVTMRFIAVFWLCLYSVRNSAKFKKTCKKRVRF